MTEACAVQILPLASSVVLSGLQDNQPGAFRAKFQPDSRVSSASYPLLGEAYSVTRVVEHVARCRAEQRDTHCMPLSSYFFPGQRHCRAKDIFCPDSCRVAPTWICKGVCGCKLGDCSYALDALDVLNIRQQAMSRTAALVTGPSAEDITLASLFEKDIHDSHVTATISRHGGHMVQDQYSC